MNVEVSFDNLLAKNQKIILPISMAQPLLQGERLQAILNALEGHDVTVLICDSLNRHNVGDEQAKQQGDEFLKAHAEILKGRKVITWEELKKSKQEIFNENIKKIEEKINAKHCLLYNKMKKTWENFSRKTELNSSIEYQKEEYAMMLSMKCNFDVIVYPKITPAMSHLYTLFPNQLPEFNTVKTKVLKSKNALSATPFPIFSASNKTEKPRKKKNPMPFALQLICEQVKLALASSEISEEAKVNFASELDSMFDLKLGPKRNSGQESTIAQERSPTAIVKS